MGYILFFILFGAVLAGIAATFVILHSRKLMREAKEYERGLKVVLLKIHLPPVSDDVDSGARDSRDVVDETISKAQALYNILASTANKKGFKTNLYGQRHIGFEIVANNGFVHFYTAVPIALQSVVTQSIISAYPSAQVQESAEHNIFSEAGKLSGTMGSELSLKEDYSRPIATYLDTKRDAMQSLLSAMATLEKDDGAAVQILLRPAKKDWVKTAQGKANDKRKGKKKSGFFDSGFFHYAKQVFIAPVKVPEDKEKKDDKPNDISGTDQNLIDSIEAKTQYPGFEVLIRVVVSSNMAQKAQAIHSNIVASFALFDAPGKNGFKSADAKDIESFITAYNLRMFPTEKDKDILNSIELASLFHIPNQENIPTTQLERQASKQVDGPRNMPDDGLILGYNVFRGAKKKVILSDKDRLRHMYAVGQTGTGKSVFLENLALQDMLNGKGFCFVDPHGDTAQRILSMVPKERTEDVIYFDPGNMDYPMGLNLFEFNHPDQIDFLIQEGINMLYKLYDEKRQGIIGPRYEYMFRNAAKAIMSDPAGGTFIDITKLFNDKSYVAEKLKHVTDKTVLDYWQKEYPASERSNDAGEIKSWFISKFSAFIGNDMMRNIIGQTESSFNLREIMDEGKILIVNLSKGKVGELNMKLLGMIFVMKFQLAAMSRVDIPNEDDRREFTLYVDEFQNFATESFASILSEARKYKLSLVVANQFTTQLIDEIRDAIFGNVGTAISFRVSAQDAENMVKQFYSPTFEVDDLTRLPLGNTAARMLIGGVPTQPFSMNTLPPLGHENSQLRDALVQLSSAKYGRPRAEVEKEIFERLEVSEEAKGSTSPGSPVQGAAPAPTASTGSSFLDDWMNKRSRPTAPPPRRPAPAPGPFQPPPPQGSAPTPAAPMPQPLSAPAPATLKPQQPLTPAPANVVSPTETKKKASEIEGEGHLEHDAEIKL
ncbi:MAG: ATP-binding protein [Patescibacteria group bacterium]